MPPIEIRQAAFQYERSNRDASLHEAFIQGYLYSQQHPTTIDSSPSPNVVLGGSPSESFDQAWQLYQRKDNKQSAIKAWNRLTDIEREKALYHIPVFVEAHPDKQYRPMLATYLNQKRFNDEEIISNAKPTNPSQAQQRFAAYTEAINNIGREG